MLRRIIRPFVFACIMDVSAENGAENLHVVGHNAQTVRTDIETVIALETDQVRKAELDALRAYCDVLIERMYALWGHAVCPSGQGCEHDHGRSVEGLPEQVGTNQRNAEQRLAELRTSKAPAEWGIR